MSRKLAFASLLAAASAQGSGDQQTETHPKMAWQRCTGPGSCTTVNGEVVIDANWRWLHLEGDTEDCYDGNEWTGCSTESECTSSSVLEGADYTITYGFQASGDALTLQFVTEHEYGTNIGMPLPPPPFPFHLDACRTAELYGARLVVVACFPVMIARLTPLPHGRREHV